MAQPGMSQELSLTVAPNRQTQETIARMEVALDQHDEELDPDQALAGLLTQEGMDPERAMTVGQSVTGSQEPDQQMVAGLGTGLQKLLKLGVPEPVRPMSRQDADRIIRLRPSQTGNFLGTSDFKPNFGGGKKTNAALNQDVTRFIQHHRMEYEAARGGRMADDDVTAAARLLHEGKLDTILKAIELPKEVLNQVETRAVLMYLRGAVDEFDTLRKAAKKKDPAAIEALRAQAGVVDELMLKISHWRAESGRTLREYNGFDLAEKFKTGHAIHDSLDIAQRFGDIPPDKFKAWMDSLESDTQLLHFFKEMAKGRSPWLRGQDVIVSSFIDSILLNAATFMRNLAGGVMMVGHTIPERGLAGFYGRFHSMENGIPVTSPREAIEMINAMGTASTKFWTAFSKMYKEGYSTSRGTKLDKVSVNAILATANKLPDGFWKSLALGVGTTWQAGSRGVVAGDEGMKAMFYHLELAAQAERYRHFLGKDRNAFLTALAEFEKNPPVEIKRSAQDFAAVNTFTRELGPMGEGLRKVAEAHPLVTRPFITFITAPANITKTGAQLVFPLNLVPLHGPSRELYTMIAAGGHQRDVALARLTLSAFYAVSVGTLVYNGVITGAPATNPTQRAMDEKRGRFGYAINLPGGTVIDYSGIEPFRTVVGTIANFMELSPFMNDDERSGWGTAITVALSSMVMDQSMVQGLAKAVELGTGLADETTTNDVIRFVEDRMASIVPGQIREIRQEFDTNKRDPRVAPSQNVYLPNGEMWRVIQEGLNQVKNRAPGGSDGLPAILGPLGEEIHTHYLMGLGIVPVHVRTDAFEDERKKTIYDAILASGLELTALMPPRTLAGPNRRAILKSFVPGLTSQLGPGANPAAIPGFELSARDYHDLVKLRARNGELEEQLYSLVTSSDFLDLKAGPEGSRAAILRRTFDKATEAAIKDFLAEREDVGDEIQKIRELQGERGKKSKR